MSSGAPSPTEGYQSGLIRPTPLRIYPLHLLDGFLDFPVEVFLQRQREDGKTEASQPIKASSIKAFSGDVSTEGYEGTRIRARSLSMT